MKILVTGAAGFIGAHTAKKLLELGHEVTGIDNLNDYYDPTLKLDRLSWISKSCPNSPFTFIEMDIASAIDISILFKHNEFDRVIHLAAQAGVRYSIENPLAYAQSNLIGHLNILEGCRHNAVPHLVYASSSSVYGSNDVMPFTTEQSVDHPVSFYAATKKCNEVMAHSYSHLYQLPTTGLRFFTVYGPWGRPDMAPMKFASAIKSGKPIDVYNYGEHQRDFTYIDDIVNGIIAAMENIPAKNNVENQQITPANSNAPYRVYNIGAQKPVHLLTFIELMEEEMGMKAEKNMLPMQPGDVERTYADVTPLKNDTGYKPEVDINEGVSRFIAWYSKYTH